MRSTRALLTSAAIGALAGLLVVALTPLTSLLAVTSPALYALVASIHMLGPLVAAAWLARPGAATLTALVSGLVALPLTTLGPLLVLALVIPAAVMDLALAALGHRARSWPWLVAAVVGALVMSAITIPVIDARVLSPVLVMLVVAARLVAFIGVALGARLVARRLGAVGIRPSPR